ncbi:MAG: OmpH family outer membrane protein [Firmicutes bacterium]|nr:OmpH family outer membrane protein [Bacillota bacterium]MCM1401627.1 OmpH family outer membrane protein [Bacteroides sp.]MCM1477793.1 OmpH family outer membrane protein [Bacteroides sp.]
MKKSVLLALLAVICCAFAGNAQKFAMVDMEYVLSNIPSYEVANNQLEQLSQRWQKEVENVAREAETMYNNYKSQMPFLTDDQKKKQEEEIVAKEKQAAELRNKYFGPEGELYKKRQSLMQPIQEQVYEAVKKVAEERAYMCIFDRATSADIIFASPRIDVSNEVLAKLGFAR